MGPKRARSTPSPTRGVKKQKAESADRSKSEKKTTDDEFLEVERPLGLWPTQSEADTIRKGFVAKTVLAIAKKLGVDSFHREGQACVTGAPQRCACLACKLQNGLVCFDCGGVGYVAANGARVERHTRACGSPRPGATIRLLAWLGLLPHHAPWLALEQECAGGCGFVVRKQTAKASWPGDGTLCPACHAVDAAEAVEAKTAPASASSSSSSSSPSTSAAAVAAVAAATTAGTTAGQASPSRTEKEQPKEEGPKEEGPLCTRDAKSCAMYASCCGYEGCSWTFSELAEGAHDEGNCAACEAARPRIAVAWNRYLELIEGLEPREPYCDCDCCVRFSSGCMRLICEADECETACEPFAKVLAEIKAIDMTLTKEGRRLYGRDDPASSIGSGYPP